MVTAQASFKGICNREQFEAPVTQVRRTGVIGTVRFGKVGPVYLSNLTITASGKSGGPPVSYSMDTMVPTAPLTRPTSTHKFVISITRAPTAICTIGSRPPASSEDPLDAFCPLCNALMEAIGLFIA